MQKKQPSKPHLVNQKITRGFTRTYSLAHRFWEGGTPHTQALRNNFSSNINSNINTLRKNPTLPPLKNLSIKDTLDCIPKFDGSNIPLSTFLFGVREAVSMVPTANEVDLAKLIRRRLMGEAAKSMEELHFDSISELIKYF